MHPISAGSVREADPGLASPTTQWLLHYHLSAPHGPGPSFWHHVVTHLPIGSATSTSEVTELITDHVQQLEGKEPNPRTMRAAATIFLGSYAKPEGLKPASTSHRPRQRRLRGHEPRSSSSVGVCRRSGGLLEKPVGGSIDGEPERRFRTWWVGVSLFSGD